MKNLVIQSWIVKNLETLSEDNHPNECCAILYGKSFHDFDLVQEMLYFHEVRSSPVHFELSNDQLIQMYAVAENLEMEIIGIFHSHPHHVALPSSTDVKYMQINPVAWIIYSGINKEMNCFRLEKGIIQPTKMEIK